MCSIKGYLTEIIILYIGVHPETYSHDDSEAQFVKRTRYNTGIRVRNIVLLQLYICTFTFFKISYTRNAQSAYLFFFIEAGGFDHEVNNS
jgi:hypothetical protein